jgi:hypothetical protein
MFVNEFFFSFFLLGFAAVLMVLGVVLLVDASRRLAKDGLTWWRNAEVAVKPVAIAKPAEKITTFEQAA